MITETELTIHVVPVGSGEFRIEAQAIHQGRKLGVRLFDSLGNLLGEARVVVPINVDQVLVEAQDDADPSRRASWFFAFQRGLALKTGKPELAGAPLRNRITMAGELWRDYVAGKIKRYEPIEGFSCAPGSLFEAVASRAIQLAQSEQPVILDGPTGVGKTELGGIHPANPIGRPHVGGKRAIAEGGHVHQVGIEEHHVGGLPLCRVIGV